MITKKIITVIGATGAQGGGLARAILNDPHSNFAVRAVTRDPNSDKAKALARLGADVVAADLDDPDSLERAFNGAYGAFCVTFFWAHFSPDLEIAQAKRMAHAARKANLKHVIWSTLEDSRQWVPVSDTRIPTLMGKYKVPHMDAKGEADQAFIEAGVPTTFLLTSFFWENFIYFGMGPRRGADGKLAITLPLMGAQLAGMAAEDIGKCAYGIFQAGLPAHNQRVGIAGEFLTGAHMAQAMGHTLGEDIAFNDVPPHVYRSFGFPGAEELGNMFQIEAEYADVVLGNRSIDMSRRLNPELQSFDMWLARNKAHIPRT
ncbi:MAG: nucleotide-diphosphate-sugar epimerase [Candidatus Roseilinea sp.]|nr:MAG: nucleotide-diphosphate-sugar epimerase [Candidatus Roseilinea sp.]